MYKFLATDSYLRAEVGSIMYRSFRILGRERFTWPGHEVLALLFSSYVNLGKLFALSS